MNDTHFTTEMPVQMFERGDGVHLAYRHRAGTAPTLVFLPGYMSDMQGSKALALDLWAAQTGSAMLRFDYSGCGASEGRFIDGSLSRWCDDARRLIEAVVAGPVLLIGSSMGGWLALLLARSMPQVHSVVGIAAAPDFTRWGLALTEAEQASLEKDGQIERPSDYGNAPYVYTKTLIEDGVAQQLLTGEIAIDVPVRLLQGQADADVPWALGLEIVDKLRSGDVQLYLVKDGDHRLSRPEDLALLIRTVQALLE
jgi:pimeloyl-ACP methyl ester carboxylesterase